MNTCKTAFFHLRNTYGKNTELSLSKRSWDTCSCFYFIRAGFLQRTSVWVTTIGSRWTTVCSKLCSSPRGWELCQLHCLPIKRRITYKILLLTYKEMNGVGPKYIVDLLKRYTPTRQLRYSSNNLLDMQKSNLKSYGERSFRVAAPRLWNASPNSIRLIQIPKCF